MKTNYSLSQKIRWLRLLIHSRSSNLNEDIALNLLAKITRKSPIIFDVGANIGLFIKAFNKSANKPQKIYAFEPSSYVYSILKLTVARFKNTECHQLAFDKDKGVITLNMPVKKSGSIRVGISHIGNTHEGDFIKETVQKSTMDEFITNHKINSVDLVKIDIEGAEYRALLGASDLLNKIRPYWFVEVSENLERFDNSANDTFQLFQKANYVCFHLNNESQWVRLSGLNGLDDFLFVPQEEADDFEFGTR